MVTTGPGIDISQATVAGIQAEKITVVGIGMFDNMTQIVVQFQKGQDWYIQTFTFNSDKTQIAEQLMDQILAGFRFTNSSQTTGCNTNSDCQNGASCMTEGPLIAN